MKKRKDIFGRKINLTKEEQTHLRMVISLAVTAMWLWRFKDSYSLIKIFKWSIYWALKVLLKIFTWASIICIPYSAYKFSLYLLNLSQPMI